MNNISVDDYAAESNKDNESGNYFNNLDKIINNLQPPSEIPKTKKTNKFLKKTAIISFITFISILLSLLIFYGFKKIKPVQISNITIDKLWQYKTLSSIYSSPLIIDINNDKVNDILINSMDGKLYAIDGISGKRLFYFETKNPILSSPAILKKSKKEKWLILAGQDNTIYAIDSNNHCVWSTIKQDLDSAIISTPIITKINHDSIPDVIAAARDGKIYAFDGDRGWLIWKSRETTGDFFSTPLLININNDNIKDIIIGSPEKKIYGIDGKTGFKIWETCSSGSISSSPVLYDNSTIFLEDEYGILYKIHDNTGSIIHQVP